MSAIKDKKLREWWDTKNVWKVTPALAYTRGWEDCKEEVLKLLKENTYTLEAKTKNNPTIWPASIINLKIKEEIEKL